MQPQICFEMHWVGIGSRNEYAQSTIIRLGLSFNFQSAETYFFKNCVAQFIISEGRFAIRFGTFSSQELIRSVT